MPLPVTESNLLRLEKAADWLAAAVDDGARQRMFAGALQAGGEAQQFGIVPGQRFGILHELRLAFGQRAGFIDDERVDFFQNLQGFGILDEHSGAGAAAYADHDRHRRGETQGAGARDDEHGDCVHQSVREARLRAEAEPRDESDDCDGDDGGDEPFGDAIGEALDGSAAALRLADELHDARQQSFAPTRSARMTNEPVPLMVAPMTLLSGRLFDRHGFAGDHGFVDRSCGLRG